MKICFLENTKFEYSYRDIHTSKLRGAENILINITNHLSNMGHDITVLNNCNNQTHKENSNWYNINQFQNPKEIIYDFAISNGDARLLNKVQAKKNIVFSYSLQSIEKFIRKGQLFSYFKHKPTFFLIGNYHIKNRSKLISIFGIKILKLAIDDMFIKTLIPREKRKNNAIFTSRGDRNLELLLKIWHEKIFPRFKSGKLFVTPYKKIIEKNNVFLRQMTTRSELIKDLLKSKVLLVPGHKAELFCLAAAEAQELCIPIVTLGIGCLYERVEHNVNGFIAKNNDEFANYTIQLFKDDSLWLKLHNNMLNKRGKNNWTNCTNDLINKMQSI
ncbi:glycosyltransferase [Candidatus Pelagibacter sp.]|nr:glycosyltransferase [Candidatus Pelagibacter sp.]